MKSLRSLVSEGDFASFFKASTPSEYVNYVTMIFDHKNVMDSASIKRYPTFAELFQTEEFTKRGWFSGPPLKHLKSRIVVDTNSMRLFYQHFLVILKQAYNIVNPQSLEQNMGCVCKDAKKFKKIIQKLEKGRPDYTKKASIDNTYPSKRI